MRSFFSPLSFEVDTDNLPVRREQARARLTVYPRMLLTQVLLAPFLVALMWQAVAHDVLLGWMGVVWAIHAIESLIWRKYHNELADVEQVRAWNIRFQRMTATVALAWGSAGVLMFMPGDLGYQALLICVVIGLASGAVAANPFHPPSAFIYQTLVILPILARLASEGEATQWVLFGMLAMYYGYLQMTSRELIKTFEQLQRSRVENEKLLSAVQERKQEAEVAYQEKSRFLATASHDLRQPLHALSLFTEALQNAAKDAETVRLSGQIGKSVTALVDMFDDLLDVSRLDAGIIEPRWQHFELGPLLDRLYGDFAPLAQAKGLSFDLPIEGGCCSQQECKSVVYSDPFLVERVMRNLISNAIRYTDQGGVKVRCQCEPDEVHLSVEDSGIGIRPDVLPYIFEEYYQADNPHRDRRKGLGLGLAIVKRIQGLLGYRIDILSEPGKGTRFSFTVPLGDASQLAQPFVITHSRYELDGKVVALVEDDPEIRESSSELMAHWGCTVVADESADEVMRKLDLAGRRPDLLVCDYRLPQGRTAIHVMKQMRDLWGNDMPAVVLTGDTSNQILQEIHASQAILLHKPIAPARLRAMMHFALHGGR